MKGIRKIVAVAMLAALTFSFAACGEPTEEKNSKDISTGTSQTAQISDGNSETPESSISENTEIEISNPQSEAESKNSDGTSSKSESQTSNQTSKPADTSQTSKPQTSNQTSSKPAEVSQTSNTTSNQNTNSNGTQTSKPAEVSQTSKPATSNQNTNSNGTQTSKPSDNNTQTSKPETKPVTPPSVKSITLNKTSLTLTVGQTAKLSYSVNPSNASYKAEWSTSNNSVASISGDGTVTAKSAGKTNITIKTSNGKSATCQVTVKAKQTESKPTQPSTDTGVSDKIAAAFQAPYEGKITGWQDTVIAYLREVGEKQYHMTWDNSFYIRNAGNDYNCSFNFPISNFDCKNGKRFRESCLFLFEELEMQSKNWGVDISDAHFKIIVEDLGYDKYHDAHRFFVYLGYG